MQRAPAERVTSGHTGMPRASSSHHVISCSCVDRGLPWHTRHTLTYHHHSSLQCDPKTPTFRARRRDPWTMVVALPLARSKVRSSYPVVVASCAKALRSACTFLCQREEISRGVWSVQMFIYIYILSINVYPNL